MKEFGDICNYYNHLKEVAQNFEDEKVTLGERMETLKEELKFYKDNLANLRCANKEGVKEIMASLGQENDETADKSSEDPDEEA